MKRSENLLKQGLHFIKHFLALGIVVSAAGCGAKVDQVGGESHFLALCETTCGSALSCIDNRCTKPCKKTSECAEFTDAECNTEKSPGRCVAKADPTPPAPPVTSASATGTTATCTRPPGEKWQCGCNTCWCTDDGSFAGTTIECSPTTIPTMVPPEASASTMPPPPPPPSSTDCSYAGKRFPFGATWTCSDGCNQCSCEMGNQVLQTEKGCGTTSCTDVDGSVHAAGSSWSCASDACKTCSCDMASSVITTTNNASCNSATTCSYAGSSFKPGDTWKCSDGCNNCSCKESGEVTSTLFPCAANVTCTDVDGSVHAPNTTWACADGCHVCSCEKFQQIKAEPSTCQPKPATCQVGDKTYKVGDSWKCSDGCNTCRCMEGGLASMTAIACKYPAACYEPQEIGPCEAAIPSFAFNVATQQCEAFSYGGCSGNDNRFASLEACKMGCAPLF